MTFPALDRVIMGSRVVDVPDEVGDDCGTMLTL